MWFSSGQGRQFGVGLLGRVFASLLSCKAPCQGQEVMVLLAGQQQRWCSLYVCCRRLVAAAQVPAFKNSVWIWLKLWTSNGCQGAFMRDGCICTAVFLW